MSSAPPPPSADHPEVLIGIDVSAATLDIAQLPNLQQWQVPNTPAGWDALIARLQLAAAPLIVLEATGKRELGLVAALDAVGLTPAVVNPLAVSHFRRSLGRRAKTDRGDAEILARYAERVRPVPGPVCPASMREMKDLLARRRQLIKQHVQELNRRATSGGGARASVERAITFLEAEIAAMDAALAARLADDPAAQTHLARFTTVPGIGRVTATALVLDLPELGRIGKGSLAALVGVAPFANDSGRLHGQRAIAGGRYHLRHALFFATTSVVRYEPTLKAHYQQLRARGKGHKEAIIACLHRLLGILNVMARDELTWSQTKVGQGLFLPNHP